ncbi:multimeric flavodoxin WrbA [Diaminobutyricimonas aerilata]|uniref:Multimeric flavodoxin WrbA n=1 Tax=Diaminobutyricimonas aerilata TaxID=1162967 RepID=A0A2M9CFF8_9MICO|nr:NAD(P)H-dependent oxidoreductase [Diaminobutyricimonas aerilata]PJJ70619.1 multimeric flavodoxin WrbA [Diaminobutyricimonas aerilata]
MDQTLTAVALNCTLKPSPAESSTDVLAGQLIAELAHHGVTTSSFRVVDYDVKPGVEADMGDGDQWPQIREQVLAADILVLATPTWMGHMTSIAQRVLERLDAELSEQDDLGRPILFDKVACAVIVGNEDGAHQISAELFQALNDVGFTIPAQGVTYWNGEAMGSIDYKDLDETPEQVATTTKSVAAYVAHLARVTKQNPYPAVS